MKESVSRRVDKLRDGLGNIGDGRYCKETINWLRDLKKKEDKQNQR
jgi:hypothetical protein